MDLITNSRELFIIEIIINYLQTVYPNIYGDKEIIRKYIIFNKLNNKKNLADIDRNIEFTSDDEAKLEELNILFFGNEDGSNSSYADLPGNYLMTLRNIKQLINSTNNSIQETITTIHSLFENNEITDNEDALKYYLDEIIIPTLLITLDTKYIQEKIDTKISREEYKFDKYKDIYDEEKLRIQKIERDRREEEKKIEAIEKQRINEIREERTDIDESLDFDTITNV